MLGFNLVKKYRETQESTDNRSLRHIVVDYNSGAQGSNALHPSESAPANKIHIEE